MSYFKNLYKTAIDSLIKGYVDAAAIKQQQQNPIPENLVLATLSDVYNATFVSGVDDSILGLSVNILSCLLKDLQKIMIIKL